MPQLVLHSVGRMFYHPAPSNEGIPPAEGITRWSTCTTTCASLNWLATAPPNHHQHTLSRHTQLGTTHTYVHTYTCMYIHTYVRMYVCTDACTHTHTVRSHTGLSKNIRTYTHTLLTEGILAMYSNFNALHIRTHVSIMVESTME